MPNPVIITRPLAQAAPLARRVAALGRDAIVFPLLEIHPLPDTTLLQAALKDVSAYALVAFVSPNAIDAAFAVRPTWPAGTTFAVMGEGSRAALAAHGISAENATVISPGDSRRTDSQTLLEALDIADLHGKSVLILRGETGRELLADALRAAGVKVKQVAAYRRAAPNLDGARGAQLTQLLNSQNDWIVTSSEALHILMQMVRQVDSIYGVAKMQHQKIIVPHARIAETARTLGFQDVLSTGSGDEGVLGALQSCA